jgi:two-component system sensor histidine kinase PilS (NtrC family)
MVLSNLKSNISDTLWRSLQTFNISRLILALILFFSLSMKSGPDLWEMDRRILFIVASVYLFCSFGFVLIKKRWNKHFTAQLMTQITIDLIVISILYVGSNGGQNGLVILYLFPLAGVGILAPLIMALFTVSAVAIFILIVNIFALLHNESSNFISQAGIYGGSFFAIVFVLNRLARNLIGQEELAKKRGYELAIQQSINHSVIEDMSDGVLVVDQRGYLIETNPAAKKMLGISALIDLIKTPYRLEQLPTLLPISQAFSKWKQGQQTNSTIWLRNEGDAFVAIRHQVLTQQESNSEKNDHTELEMHLKLRFLMVSDGVVGGNANDNNPNAPQYTIIFMQNVSDIENQAQQLKLASMGRLTASIAHEVRNPLASISYAASLLGEDIHNETQSKRLLKIVEDNVTRLNQLIEDILKLSRKAQVNIKAYYLIDVLNQIVTEFVETHAIQNEVISVIDAANFKVTFDPSHLREVVTNLLSNAIRYASGKPNSIRLYAQLGHLQRKELHIQDDGPGISSEVRAHLFEPFYTTSHKGTGLGLYMARELCLNNHSVLDYEYRNDDSSTFNIGVGGRFIINFSTLDHT